MYLKVDCYGRQPFCSYIFPADEVSFGTVVVDEWKDGDEWGRIIFGPDGDLSHIRQTVLTGTPPRKSEQVSPVYRWAFVTKDGVDHFVLSDSPMYVMGPDGKTIDRVR